ncbi:MAG: hypothetical protein HY912_18865 [Desulfomonile tiedjei]|uniref:Uncharacterized protein n=1 Tax=Desulfomonile tiedjei TaxID=2358 RepID=A0A9D6V9S6_9BACT|nr:hypothetical protein [Desulfomonile tiedjei]
MPMKIIAPDVESRDARFKLHKLIAQGFSEHHALARVFPRDPNRRRRLREWQQQGLWPIPAEELKQWDGGKASSEEAKVKKSPENSSTRGPAVVGGMQTHELEQSAADIVRRELSRLFESVAISPIPKTGKKGRRAIKKAFTVPSDLWAEIEQLFPGEIMSNVISAALRLYVNSKKEVERENGPKN